MKKNSLVSVIVLHYKQKQYIHPCLNSLVSQTYSPLEIFFVDNNSGDIGFDRLQETYPAVRFLANRENLFFSKAFNAAIRRTKGELVMPMNVDVKLSPTFIQEMVRAMDIGENVGMVSGKLLQMTDDFLPMKPPKIDSTGIYLTPAMRHFDRGSQEIDDGQYSELEYIFGPSGATPLYRRQMLNDIAFDKEYFDEDFVIYREDVDLVWRGQTLGWKGVYSPQAIAYHVRRIRPGDDRRKFPPILNFHSVKNRFLLRLKNLTFINALRFFFPSLIRDILVIGYVCVREWSSLAAMATVIKLLPRTLAKRKDLMKKKKVSSRYIAAWISNRPTAFPISDKKQKER
jgi:GT2 family glycosyltransferase